MVIEVVKTIFGTCGVRRKFDENFSGPQWLAIGMSIGTYLGRNSLVLIGRDTRQTAELVQYAIISGLLSCGCEVHVLQGSSESPYVTTSTIAYATKHFQADAGIQVTASHNTPEYIGIKLWQKSGMGFTPAMEEAIDDIFTRRAFKLVPWSEVNKVRNILNANDIHLKAIIEKCRLPLNFKGKPFTVAIDPGNGAACEIAPRLLQKLGVNVVTINAQPDGLFPGRDSEPTLRNLRMLIRMLQNDDELHLGIAYDGDADRVRFIDGKGRLIDGDRILLLFALYHRDIDKRSPFIITPVNSSTVLEDVLKPRNISVARTKIGDIPVAIHIQELNAKLGGEISGTYTWPEFHLGPDSLYSTAKLLEIIADNGPLEKLVETFPQYSVVHENIELEEGIFSRMTTKFISALLNEVLATKKVKILDTTTIDGILTRFDGGFVLARLSGTSPVVRLTCEHVHPDVGQDLLEGLKKRILGELSSGNKQE